MNFFRRATVGVLATVAIASLTGCNGGSSSVNPFAPSRGTVRFIDGSPDAGTVDVAIGKANQPNFTGLVYAGTGFNSSTNSNAGISSYTPFNAPTQSIFIYQSGTSTQISVPQSSITITPNGRTTIVLTGSVAKKNLRLVQFNEVLYSTVAGAASVSFHHASVANATTKYTVGIYPFVSSAGSCTTGFAQIPPQIIFATKPTVQIGIAQYASTGIGFCAYSSAAASGVTITPSQVDVSNTANVMPFSGTGSINGDQNLSTYLIDGPSSAGHPVLVGVFDPDN
jgi:hypothetical protein